MKITILQGAFLPVPPALGGAVEKMWFALGNEFANRGHQVTHLSRQFAQLPEQEVIGGVLHKRVKGFSTPSSGLYLKWLDLLYTHRASSSIPPDSDVIVTNTFWAPIILKKELQGRCFVDVARLPKGQMKLYRRAGWLRANSTVVAVAIKKELPSADWRRVVMIPNPLPFEVTETVDLSAKKRILLYTGRVHPEKGLELLIDAFKKIESDWQLRIIGPHNVAAGGGGEAYLSALEKRAAGHAVEFIGPVYQLDALNRHYQEAAVFVYPSVAEQGETFGLAPLEAMAWGCVPVVSGLPCFQDFIQHGENGLVFDHRAANKVELLSRAIQRLMTDKGFSLCLAQNAVRVQTSHSVSRIASDFLSEFGNVRLRKKTNAVL